MHKQSDITATVYRYTVHGVADSILAIFFSFPRRRKELRAIFYAEITRNIAIMLTTVKRWRPFIMIDVL